MIKTFTKATVFAAAMLTGTAAMAQMAIGVKGGISIPNLTGGSSNNPLNTGYSSRLGGDAAVFVNFPIAGVFSIEPQIEYSAQGGKKDGFQAYPVPAEYAQMGLQTPYLYADFKSETKLNYLLIPVLAKFNFNLGTHLSLFVDAGPFIGFLLSAKQVTSGTSPVYADDQKQAMLAPSADFGQTTDVKNSIQSVNYGIEGDVGLAYGFGIYKVFIEGGGNYGFSNIQKSSADGQNHTGAATARIGISRQL